MQINVLPPFISSRQDITQNKAKQTLLLLMVWTSHWIHPDIMHIQCISADHWIHLDVQSSSEVNDNIYHHIANDILFKFELYIFTSIAIANKDVKLTPNMVNHERHECMNIILKNIVNNIYE
eukprot:178360_1